MEYLKLQSIEEKLQHKVFNLKNLKVIRMLSLLLFSLWESLRIDALHCVQIYKRVKIQVDIYRILWGLNLHTTKKSWNCQKLSNLYDL